MDHRRLYLPVLLIASVHVALGQQTEKPTAEVPNGTDFFESSVRPILTAHCVECHGEETQESNLRLDGWQGMRAGGKAGSAIVPGHPEQSLLITAVRYTDPQLQMPPDDRLSPEQVDVLSKWIELGAPHPDRGLDADEAVDERRDTQQVWQTHWAFQPILRPELPSNAAFHPIDRFIQAGLEQHALAPSERADRATLLRRVTLDLTGLPPTPDDIESFIRDDSPRAWDNVIDRLLDSPRYGERWGRHWLDVARYADSNGLDENIAHGNAWRYRDYVVAAFNRDKPFDEFVREQLAGDLLPKSAVPELNHQRLIATGFLSLGPKVLAEVDETKMEMDIVDEQIDTISRTFMGITLGCARCHDHKFDPFTQADYYGLAGIFKSTHTMDSFTKIAKWHENAIPTEAEIQAVKAHERKVVQLEQAIAECGQESDAERKQLEEQLAALKKTPPTFSSAMGVQEGKVVDVPLHVRGSHLTLARVIPRRLPRLAPAENSGLPLTKFTIATDDSGRLQLAQWLTNPNHPLTTRVIVNRVWRWHFGRGIVSSTDNFGTQGEKPTHPELLDWLACYFRDHHYSLKALHRLILTSETYQRSSQRREEMAELDPANLWYWKYSARRVEAEALRDSILAVSGLLDSTMGGSLLNVANREFVFNHESRENVNYEFHRRSLYLPVIRNHLYPMFRLFDYTDASVLNGDRQTSTVATQALFLMNSPFMQEASGALADRIMQHAADTPSRLEHLYEIAYSRYPSPVEIERAIGFLTESADERDGWRQLCQAVLMANEFSLLP